VRRDRRSAVRAVLFDLDDTLFDHRHSNVCALTRLRDLHPCLRSVDPETLERRYLELLHYVFPRVLSGEITIAEARHLRFHRLLEEYGGDEAAREAASVAAEYIQHYRASWRPVPGALELLDALMPHVRIGIVTNGVVPEQADKIRICDIGPRLDAVVISEEAGTSKPDPAIFRTALARLDSSPEEALMVGDSWEDDILGAQETGLPAVWVNRYGKPCPDTDLAHEIGALEPVEEVAALILGEHVEGEHAERPHHE